MIKYPGTDISDKFYPYFKEEVDASIAAANETSEEEVKFQLYELLTSATLYDTRIRKMPETPGAYVAPVGCKVRFKCPGCKNTWTSGLGQLAVILL